MISLLSEVKTYLQLCRGKYAGYLQLWFGRYADYQAIHEAIEGRIATALKEKETLNVGMKAIPTPGK